MSFRHMKHGHMTLSQDAGVRAWHKLASPVNFKSHSLRERFIEVDCEDHSLRTFLNGEFDVDHSTSPIRQGDIAEHLGHIQLIP